MSSKTTKKSKEQKEEERKRREEERARRDAEKAKKRLTLRAKIAENKEQKTKSKPPLSPRTSAHTEKEQRKKVLRFRRAQSRFALPKIDQDDDMDAIAKANAELNAQIAEQEQQKAEQAASQEADTNKADTNKAEADKTDANDDDDDNKQQDDEKKEDGDEAQRRTSMASFASVEELTLSKEQEEALEKVTNELEAADPDYYGFVDFQKFISVLKSNEVTLSARHETYLMGALTLIDEGVDYYDFSRKVREVGRTLLPDNTLQEICEEIAESVEKEQKQEEQEKEVAIPTTNIEEMSSADIANVDEESAEFEAFFKKAQQYRGRGMSLARMKSTAKDVDKGTRLGELIDDLALDGADVDFALLKTALSTIDCNPPDKDLKYIINHLCEDDSGFVDFNYLITFLQETSGVPAQKWTKIEKIISKVVNQLQMVERAEKRRQDQAAKLAARLEKRITKKGGQSEDELAQIAREEKLLRAKRLREKAAQIK
eukprot:CAMPEP_0197021282 /NCGR_PEP_ID=MMETSP1384-20130603/2164_1 /TAXON_ID=29189 /ORGANISM="Ammonia sp." /LENGTH=486 /DNA_ID=CAMNT_0042449069 /DNA_START=940 /DNA_END=2400 /DNA_ORIENTATION=-